MKEAIWVHYGNVGLWIWPWIVTKEVWIWASAAWIWPFCSTPALLKQWKVPFNWVIQNNPDNWVAVCCRTASNTCAHLELIDFYWLFFFFLLTCWLLFRTSNKNFLTFEIFFKVLLPELGFQALNVVTFRSKKLWLLLKMFKFDNIHQVANHPFSVRFFSRQHFYIFILISV